MAKGITHVSPSRVIAMHARPKLLVMALAGKATRAEFEIAAEQMLGHPGLEPRFAVLCHITAGATFEAPDDGFRKYVAELISARSERIAGFAYAVVGDGFRSAITRSVITSISVLSRRTHPEKVFASVPAATEWLSRQMPEGASADEIVAALAELLALRAG